MPVGIIDKNIYHHHYFNLNQWFDFTDVLTSFLSNSIVYVRNVALSKTWNYPSWMICHAITSGSVFREILNKHGSRDVIICREGKSCTIHPVNIIYVHTDYDRTHYRWNSAKKFFFYIFFWWKLVYLNYKDEKYVRFLSSQQYNRFSSSVVVNVIIRRK